MQIRAEACRITGAGYAQSSIPIRAQQLMCTQYSLPLTRLNPTLCVASLSHVHRVPRTRQKKKEHSSRGKDIGNNVSSFQTFAKLSGSSCVSFYFLVCSSINYPVLFWRPASASSCHSSLLWCSPGNEREETITCVQ